MANVPLAKRCSSHRAPDHGAALGGEGATTRAASPGHPLRKFAKTTLSVLGRLSGRDPVVVRSLQGGGAGAGKGPPEGGEPPVAAAASAGAATAETPPTPAFGASAADRRQLRRQTPASTPLEQTVFGMANYRAPAAGAQHLRARQLYANLHRVATHPGVKAACQGHMSALDRVARLRAFADAFDRLPYRKYREAPACRRMWGGDGRCVVSGCEECCRWFPCSAPRCTERDEPGAAPTTRCVHVGHFSWDEFWDAWVRYGVCIFCSACVCQEGCVHVEAVCDLSAERQRPTDTSTDTATERVKALFAQEKETSVMRGWVAFRERNLTVLKESQDEREVRAGPEVDRARTDAFHEFRGTLELARRRQPRGAELPLSEIGALYRDSEDAFTAHRALLTAPSKSDADAAVREAYDASSALHLEMLAAQETWVLEHGIGEKGEGAGVLSSDDTDVHA